MTTAAPIITNPANQRTTSTAPPITGTGIDGDTVTLFVGAPQGGSATVAAGVWSIPTGTLAVGAYSITATQALAGDTSAPTAPLTLNIIPRRQARPTCWQRRIAAHRPRTTSPTSPAPTSAAAA